MLEERLEGGDEEATALFDDAAEYYQSFENRVKKSWDSLSAPYLKGSKEELNDFIVEGDDDEEEDASPRFVFQREYVDPEEEIVRILKQRMSGGNASVDSSRHEDEEGEEEDEHLSLADSNEDEAGIPGYYSEEEDEDDEWVKSKLVRPRKRAKVTPPSANKSDSTPAHGKLLGNGRGTPQGKGRPKEDATSPDINRSAKKAKRRVIIESDSDDSDKHNI